MLLHLFRYFSSGELRGTLAPVCRKWWRVTQLPELWPALRYRGATGIPPDYMCRQMRVLSAHLQSVRLFDVPDVVTVIRQLCRCVPRIVSVAVRECSHALQGGRLPESVLRNLIASCTRLQEIDLKVHI